MLLDQAQAKWYCKECGTRLGGYGEPCPVCVRDAEIKRLVEENERLRGVLAEICPYCGGRVDVQPGHIERCYCLPVVRRKDEIIADLYAKNDALAGKLSEIMDEYERLKREWLND